MDFDLRILFLKPGQNGRHQVDADEIGRAETQFAMLHIFKLADVFMSVIVSRDHLFRKAHEMLALYG